ncbi:CLUMA_CG010972, isoform A [Clunio marinus]|uniref:CLUMA_CG010972, isoform A n=1 Tax=Clunio marinus TaxID=568069 RepID=A0A1J1ICW1_9DIPT|nr:CLUMA_CG010972, isoform A [Clunio marinus]
MNKFFRVSLLVFVITQTSNSNGAARNRRWSLWPSEEVKKDIQTGKTYSQLPPDYLYLLPGVNDHKDIQRRAGGHPYPPPGHPVRFVNPPRMSGQTQQQRVNHMPSVNTQNQQQHHPQQAPKIIMKPVNPNPNFNPSISLNGRVQPLPDIHQNQRFVHQNSGHNGVPIQQPFSSNQHLPIKKSFDTLPTAVTYEPLSIKTAAIEEFYYTKEFRDLLKEFKIKADITKLPPITDVMMILGTENAEDTIDGIREVAQSQEGMELIKSYLDHDENRIDDDEFYNYDEDVRAGEIQLSQSEQIPFIQSHDLLPEQYGVPSNEYGPPHQNNEVPDNMIQPVQGPFDFPYPTYEVPTKPSPSPPSNQPTKASTTGTLTGNNQNGSPRIWWRPSTWFNSAPPTRVESLTKDAQLLGKVTSVPRSGTWWDVLRYVGRFLTPTTREKVPLNETSNPKSSVQRQYIHPNIRQTSGESPVLPAIQLTQEQYYQMVQALRESSAGQQYMDTSSTFNSYPQEAVQNNFYPKDVIPTSFYLQEMMQNNFNQLETLQSKTEKVETTTTKKPTETKFSNPINVPSENLGKPLSSNYVLDLPPKPPQPTLELPNAETFNNRRNFFPPTEPKRNAPHDFIASGRVHQANPDEVWNKSKSLVQTNEDEKTVISSISDLTEQYQNDQQHQ